MLQFKVIYNRYDYPEGRPCDGFVWWYKVLDNDPTWKKTVDFVRAEVAERYGRAVADAVHLVDFR